jgi:hypothetical protein
MIYGTPPIITNGLVLALDAGNTISYPRTGTLWKDLSGNSNGTLVNGPTFDAGNGGNIVLDGTNDYIDFGTISGGIGGSSAATMELFINMTFPAALQQIFGFRNNSGFDFFFLAFSGGGTEFRARNSAGTIFDLNPSLSFYSNKWVQINFSVGPSGRRVYANGDLIASNPTWTGTFGSTAPLNLGNDARNFWFATGKVSIAKLYNRELSQFEVLQNYNATKTRFGL